MNKLIFFLLISCSSCCGGYWKNRMDVIIENNSILFNYFNGTVNKILIDTLNSLIVLNK